MKYAGKPSPMTRSTCSRRSRRTASIWSTIVSCERAQKRHPHDRRGVPVLASSRHSRSAYGRCLGPRTARLLSSTGDPPPSRGPDHAIPVDPFSAIISAPRAPATSPRPGRSAAGRSRLQRASIRSDDEPFSPSADDSSVPPESLHVMSALPAWCGRGGDVAVVLVGRGCRRRRGCAPISSAFSLSVIQRGISVHATLEVGAADERLELGKLARGVRGRRRPRGASAREGARPPATRERRPLVRRFMRPGTTT